MKKISAFIKQYNVFFLFAATVLISAGAYLIYAYNVGVSAQYWLAMSNSDDRFFDYRIHIYNVADPKNLYSRSKPFEGCFPPLAYLMYNFFYRIIAIPGFIPEAGDLWQMDFLLTGLTYYTVMVVLILYFGIGLYAGKEHPYAKTIFFACLLLSTPIYECLMIGNSVLLVMAMLLIAYKLRDSDSPVQKEIALILIAASAGFKIYPAIMGLTYLREKRYKEALRLIVYGIVLFFVPFVFFGGTDGFKAWLSNVISTMGMMDDLRIQSVKEASHTLLHLMGFEMPAAFYTVLSLVFVLCMILLAWFTPSKNRSVFYLCSIMMFFPSQACRYTLCYMIIPMTMYFFDTAASNEYKPTAFDYVYTTMYTAIYAIPMIWGFITGFRPGIYYMLTYVEIWLYGLAYLFLLIMAVHEIRVIKFSSL